MRDPHNVPGCDLAWLRRVLETRVRIDPPPLTVPAAEELRRLVVLQIEHGVLGVRRGRAMLRQLERQETWIREHEFRL
jgi:hypothetical protein